MSREIQVMFDCADPELLSRFWAAVPGYVNPPPPGREVPEGQDVFSAWHEFLADQHVLESEWNGASAAQDPDGSGPRLFFQVVPEGKTAKNRVHLDVRAAPGLTGAAVRCRGRGSAGGRSATRTAPGRATIFTPVSVGRPTAGT